MARFKWSDSKFEEITKRIDEESEGTVDKNSIVEILKKHPNGLKAKEIVAYIHGTDKKSINQVLYSNPNLFSRNDNYEWTLKQIENQKTRKRVSTMEMYDSLCKADAEANRLQQENGHIKSFSPSASYNMFSGNQITGTFSITKSGQGYRIDSTNNLIPCCDCNRFFSIHALACPSCGCPLSHIAELYFNEWTKIQSQEEELERKKHEEEQRQKEQDRLTELERRREELLRERDKLIREREKLMREQEEAEKLRVRTAEIREICEQLSLPDKIITELAKSSVDDKTLRARVNRILYYQQNRPDLKIDPSKFITNDNLSNYVSRHTINVRDQRTDCVGNCSICRREECVLTTRR